MAAAPSNVDFSRSVKAYITVDDQLASVRKSAKDCREQMKDLGKHITHHMTSNQLQIVQIPTSNCELELKEKVDRSNTDPPAVCRVREVLGGLQGQVLTKEHEVLILEAVAPPKSVRGKKVEGGEDTSDEGPGYTIKRRKLRAKKEIDDSNP